MKHKPARSTDTSPGSRKNLDELEAEVQTSTIERHQDVVAGVEQLLNCYLEGLTNIGQFTITEENQRELVWFFIESRSVNSMRWAFELMTRGYYVQSITLIRLVYEDWLVCWDCIDHPNTVKAILAGNTRMPTFSDMADRLKEPHRSLWKGETQEVEGTYGLLSTFAHPRHRALMVQRDPDSQSLRLGPLYDQVLFLFTAHYLLSVGIRMTEFLGRISNDPTWLKDVLLRVINNSQALNEQIVAKSKRLLESPS